MVGDNYEQVLISEVNHRFNNGYEQQMVEVVNTWLSERIKPAFICCNVCLGRIAEAKLLLLTVRFVSKTAIDNERRAYAIISPSI